MKRALLVMVLGLGIGLMGCAAGVEDDVVPAPAPEEQRDPPKQSLNTELRDPQLQLIGQIEDNDALKRVPTTRPIPAPIPLPE